MVNVMKHNYLFPTLLSEFEYVADEKFIKCIKNEDIMNKKLLVFTQYLQWIINYKKKKNINH